MKRLLWTRPRARFANGAWSLLGLRVLVGFGFAAHGYAKLERGPEQFAAIILAMHLPAPLVAAWFTTLLELAGGAAVMVGAGVAPLSVPLIAVMLVALTEVHWRYGFSSIRLKALSAAGAEFGPVGYELNLLYIAALLALALGPPTPLSLDGWIRRLRQSRSS